MMQNCNLRTAGAALGALLLTFLAACSDVPSGLRQPDPGPLRSERAIATEADLLMTESATRPPRAGERRARRTLRGPNGQVLTVESILNADGRPGESVVSRDGQVVMRLSNEWAPGREPQLLRQVVFVRGPNGAVRRFDSRDMSMPLRVSARAELRTGAEAVALLVKSRLTRLSDPAFGDCDAEVKATDIATWQYVAAAASLMIAASTGSYFATSAAFSLYLSSYANYTSKANELDKCVDAIGKKRPVDEL